MEVTYWTKIQGLGYVNIPHYVQKLFNKKENLRITRENILLIVRDYNNIKLTITELEAPLFKEHMEQLDKIIEPGIVRHNWVQNVDNFVWNCRKECMDVLSKVKKFQNNYNKINIEFDKISSSTLTNIQKKLYLLNDFLRQ